MITPVGSSTSFKGVYYSKMDKDALSQKEQASLATLGDFIFSDNSINFCDFNFGKVRETSEGKDVFVKITLDDFGKYKTAHIPITNNFNQVKDTLAILEKKVYELKHGIYNEMTNSLEDLD